MVIFNPLNIAREDVVEASVEFPHGIPKSVRVTAPDGKDVPAQISGGKVLLVASLPSVGYAVYDVQPTDGPVASSSLQVSRDQLENAYYRVRLNQDGDVASIFDKENGRELLSAPARLGSVFAWDPSQWPA